MAQLTILVIFTATIFGSVKCMGHHHSSEEDDDDAGLTMGQIAAIAIGGAVVVALIIISVIALIIKCNKKSKQIVQPTKPTHGDTLVVPINAVANKMPLYEDLPPMYSIRDDGEEQKVSLPPYSETYPTKYAG